MWGISNTPHGYAGNPAGVLCGAATGADHKEGRLVSPATKLCGFLILLAVVFAAAYAAGARVGPVNASYVHQGGGGMQMGGSP
jgi:hypothetical protein